MNDITPKKRLISIGDLVLDIILPVNLPLMAENHQGTNYRRIEPGGAGNVMIAATRMGLEVLAVGAIGSDLFGQQVLELLQQEGINTDHAYALPTSTTTLVIALTDQSSGKHTFIGHYGKGPEVPYPMDMDEVIGSCDAVFLQGYTMQERNVVPLAMRMVEQAERANVPVYFDAGPLIVNVSAQHQRWILDKINVLMMTEDEAKLLSRAMLYGADYQRLLTNHKPDLLVVKKGDKGCTLITAEGEMNFPAFNVPVVDTVGAGDCFDAAFIASRLQGRTLEDSAVIANAMGAAAVQKIIAGRQAPTCKEVAYTLAKAKSEVRPLC